MSIKKQEFYEGAALHVLARSGHINNLRYDEPFFFLNKKIAVLLKYCTRVRSPWGFTFTPGEQVLLRKTAEKFQTSIGLVCGDDGVAAMSYESYLSIAALRSGAIHIACRRHHGEHYEVSGPDGALDRKIAPSRWQKLLDAEVLIP